MLPEHEQRFWRIFEEFMQRPGGDYAQLLARGHVVSPDGVDPERWRAEIRAQARRDKIHVSTFRDGDHAIAVHRRNYSDQEVREELERGALLGRLAAAARKHGHDLAPWLRHDQESVAFCCNCDARIYVATGDQPVTDEHQLSSVCPACPA